MRKIVTQIRSGNIFSYHTIFHFYLYPYFVLTFTAIKPPAFLQFFDNNITFHFQTVRLQFESLSWNISSQFGQTLVRVFTNSLLRYKNIHSLYIVFWSRQNSFKESRTKNSLIRRSMSLVIASKSVKPFPSFFLTNISN